MSSRFYDKQGSSEIQSPSSSNKAGGHKLVGAGRNQKNQPFRAPKQRLMPGHPAIQSPPQHSMVQAFVRRQKIATNTAKLVPPSRGRLGTGSGAEGDGALTVRVIDVVGGFEGHEEIHRLDGVARGTSLAVLKARVGAEIKLEPKAFNLSKDKDQRGLTISAMGLGTLLGAAPSGGEITLYTKKPTRKLGPRNAANMPRPM